MSSDEEVEVVDADCSRSRLNSLKSVAKHLLFSTDTQVNDELVKKEITDITEKELNVLVKIISILKPYIPPKKDRYVIGYQLPLCLLANDVLQAVNHAKFTRLLFPKPSPTHLQALDISAPALYQMLTSEPNALSLADFNSNKIDSIEYARSNKDAVFCSIFDMSQINEDSKMYNLAFAQNIKVMPGLKTCKVLGSRTIHEAAEDEEDVSNTYLSRILNHPAVIQESKKNSSTLAQEIATLDGEVKILKNRLLDLYKSDKVIKLSMEIKNIKADLRNSNSAELKVKLKNCKHQKFNAYMEIQNVEVSQVNFKSKLVLQENGFAL